ncbi:hypothetical protein ABIE13_002431 [Ottowia thiooxydans]|uniref:Uncharacterized protein n=1 Tax=Ottowia thiooxydans TaxID=219182 RepID=A0ABV2Q9L3_9BURK
MCNLAWAPKSDRYNFHPRQTSVDNCDVMPVLSTGFSDAVPMVGKRQSPHPRGCTSSRQPCGERFWYFLGAPSSSLAIRGYLQTLQCQAGAWRSQEEQPMQESGRAVAEASERHAAKGFGISWERQAPAWQFGGICERCNAKLELGAPRMNSRMRESGRAVAGTSESQVARGFGITWERQAPAWQFGGHLRTLRYQARAQRSQRWRISRKAGGRASSAS